MCEVDGRPQRFESEVRRDGHCVGAQLRRVVEPGGAVRGHRGADVAALGVGEHQGPPLTTTRDDPFEYGETSRTERLEERDLRFDHRRHRTERLDADVGEAGQSVGVDGQSPLGQQRGVRVDPGAEPSAPGDRIEISRAETDWCRICLTVHR